MSRSRCSGATEVAQPGKDSGLTSRGKAQKYRNALKQEYDNGWRSHHQELADYIQPRRARFLWTDAANAGQKKSEKINNNVATEASDTLRAGLISGTCSSSRPWFKFTTHRPDLNESEAVKEWLHESERIVQGVLAKSNFYLRVEELYGDLGDFGTAVLHIEPDTEGDEVIRCYVFPVGSYYLGQSARMEVDTIFRDVPMTVKQLVKKFKYEKCCRDVRNAYDRGDLYQVFNVVHFITPNTEYVSNALGARGKKWMSAWYEESRSEEEGFLHEGGYDYFPVMAPRWKVAGTDTYGSSPGMNALPDVKQLQHVEEQKMGLFDKTVNPPLNVPVRLRGQQASLLPGAENYVEGNGQKIEPAIVINPAALQHCLEAISKLEERIRVSYHADLFRLLEQFKSGQMTAYEVAQRIQEKMQLLGPAYERTEEELLDPAMDAILHICFEAFLLPPVPEELAGEEIKIEYTSIVAQALKASGTGAIRELLQLIGNLFAVDQDILDNIDLDKVVAEYANMLGISPKLMREPEQVKAIRDERHKMAQQQAAMQQAQDMAKSAEVLSKTDTQNKNALTDMLGPSGRGPV
jgi:hypothetical protein